MIHGQYNIQWTLIDKSGSKLWDIDNVPNPDGNLTYLFLDGYNVDYKISKALPYTPGYSYEKYDLLTYDDKIYMVKSPFVASGNIQDDKQYLRLASNKYEIKEIMFDIAPPEITIPLEKPNDDKDRSVWILEYKSISNIKAFVFANSNPLLYEYTQYYSELTDTFKPITKREYKYSSTQGSYHSSDELDANMYDYTYFEVIPK